MSNEKLKDDISWIKQMAEEGKNSPIKGHVIGVWWGVISFIVMLVHWGVVSDNLPIAIENVGFVWLAYILVGSIGTFILIKNLKNKPGFDSINNRVAGSTWMLASAGIFTFYIGSIIATLSFSVPFWIFNAILPVAFICYGIAHGVAAILVSNRVSGFMAAISFVLALIMFPFLLSPTIYLIAAFAILFVGITPAISQALAKK